MVSFGATAAGCLNSKRLLSTSCNKQGQRKRVAFFMVLFPMLFEVPQNRMCRKLNETLSNELKFHIVNIY